MEPPEEEIIEETPFQTILESKGLTPYVCDEFDLHVSSDFNTLTIRIDGSLQSDLDWSAAKKQAEEAIAKGFAIFWDINMGLFADLTLPIGNQTQFLSLGLSIDHFKDTLWKEYADHSIGLSLYRGEVDFSSHFKWDDDQIHNLQDWLKEHFSNLEKLAEVTGLVDLTKIEPGDLYLSQSGKTILALFCRDVAIEYLTLLASRLPDTIPCYLFLDAGSIQTNPLKQIQLLNPDRFDFLNLALKGTALPFKAWGWQSSATDEGYAGIVPRKAPRGQEIKIGVCLPLMNFVQPQHWVSFVPALTFLIERQIPIRLIAESHLIHQWDGLDLLLFNPSGLSSQGKRKLQGFCAAGGLAVSLGDPIGLSNELTFADWVLEKNR
jgi:hypothetical protein